MKFISTPLEGVLVIEQVVFSDARGSFCETYSAEPFHANGVADIFVQDNHSISAKGVLRGLHYQIEPKAQAKLVRVVQGEAFDVVVDIRPGSKTFGRFVAEVLSAANRKMLYVPKGFAHGFLALTDGTELLYKVSDYYSPSHERGILWNDPAVGIPWPKLVGGALLSDKDKKYPLLSQAIKP